MQSATKAASGSFSVALSLRCPGVLFLLDFYYSPREEAASFLREIAKFQRSLLHEITREESERGTRTDTWRRARVDGETQMASSGTTLDLNKPSIAAIARCCIASTAAGRPPLFFSFSSSASLCLYLPLARSRSTLCVEWPADSIGSPPIHCFEFSYVSSLRAEDNGRMKTSRDRPPRASLSSPSSGPLGLCDATP